MPIAKWSGGCALSHSAHKATIRDKSVCPDIIRSYPGLGIPGLLPPPMRTVEGRTSRKASTSWRRASGLVLRPPANQQPAWYRVGAPKHATPTAHLTCKSSPTPRRPPSPSTQFSSSMLAICPFYHRGTMAAAPFSHDLATMLFSLPGV